MQNAVREHRVVVLMGPRQVGKSTLLRRATPFSNWRYYTFDEYDVLRQAEAEPQSLWAGTSQIIIGEVQKLPALLPAIKRAVDTRKGSLHFVLSGSTNLLLMRKVSESVSCADVEGLRLFMKEHPRATYGAVIYRGSEMRRRDERIVAVPLSLVPGE